MLNKKLILSLSIAFVITNLHAMEKKSEIDHLFNLVDEENIEKLKEIDGELLKSRNHDEETLLGYALFNRKEAVVAFLIKEKDANVNEKSGYFNIPPLSTAISSGASQETIDLILNRPNIEINAKSSDGRTALHEAVFFKKNQFIEQLIQAKADVNTEDRTGETPLGYAKCDMINPKGNPEAIEILLKYGAKQNAVSHKIKKMSSDLENPILGTKKIKLITPDSSSEKKQNSSKNL